MTSMLEALGKLRGTALLALLFLVSMIVGGIIRVVQITVLRKDPQDEAVKAWTNWVYSLTDEVKEKESEWADPPKKQKEWA